MIRTPAQWAVAVARNREISLASDLGGACQITYGRYFWPLEPTHPGNDYDIEFIAHSLATKTRWAGVMADENGDPIEYSVAQHSCIIADMVARPARMYGLMHDASEAYLEDVPRPIKPRLGDYYPIEAALMAEIINQFGVTYTPAIKAAVRVYDDAMIFWERDLLVGQPVVPYENEADHPGGTLFNYVPDFSPWDAKTAKRNFLAKFAEIEAEDMRIAA